MLYSKIETWRRSGGCREGHIISEEDNRMLQGEFENHEIWDCVKLCAGDKAPGPDGYTMTFRVHCWEAVGRKSLLQ